MFTLAASIALWALKLLGASDFFAGRFVTSWVFRPLVIALVAGGGYLGVTQGLPAMKRSYDAHVAERATETFRLRLKNEELAAKARAEDEARLQASETLRSRDVELAVLRTVVDKMKEEKSDARRASPDADLVVVPAHDPWLRAGARQ